MSMSVEEYAENEGDELPAALPARVKKKKCPKCGELKPAINKYFDKKGDSADGLQSYCKKCKSNMHKRKRKVDIGFRIRHHFTTRIRDQLGDNCPAKLGRRELNVLLNYSMRDLRSALDSRIQADEGISIKEAISDGYHIDHIIPLHSFCCEEVKSEAGLANFRECWAISNLKLISAKENLAKGGKIDESNT